MPLVSICLPNFNTRQFLGARMASIKNQTLRDWELIVCDSYSDDGAWEYLCGYTKDPRIQLFQVPREGLFAGWNECLRRVSGRYVYIATSDDTAYPNLLERLVGVLERFPRAGVGIGKFDFIDEQGRIIAPTQGIPGSFFGAWQNVPHLRSGWVDFLVHTQMGTSWTSITSALFRADIVKRAGLFRTDVGKGESYADRFWAMKVACLADTVSVPEVVATWRVHPGQASRREAAGWRTKNLRMTEETIQECAHRIPPQWKQDPQWLNKLLFGMRQYYLDGFGLNRMIMKRSPSMFLKGVGRALFREPGYLMRRLTSGLSWDTEDMSDAQKMVNELIQEWQVPWPPEPVTDQRGG